jgi:dTDP-4-dehydrorhamnose 3,5-epimerase
MANSHKQPILIRSDISVDDRGQLTFANDFSFEGIRRFYMVENFSTQTVRAFHGHSKEEKHIFVATGSAIVVAIAMDDTIRPNRNNKAHRFILSSRCPQILHVPAGFVNGFKSLENDTRVVYFSTATLEESADDDYRFPYDYWGTDIWKVESR